MLKVIQLTTNSRQTHVAHCAPYRISRHLTTMLTTPHDISRQFTTPRQLTTCLTTMLTTFPRQFSTTTHDIRQNLKKLPVLLA
eukprot:scaffold53205_cov21-Cyclotella_meneghiniana.AAC.2